jgi:16S rRNA (uracil1498-N3)-methyltransferase
LRKFFVNSNQILENEIEIIGEDVNHIKNVLRLENGETIKIGDKLSGENYICEISNISRESIKCKILEKIGLEVEGNIVLTVFQGLPKADKMELIIQKGTELGVNNFVPVELKRSIVKLSRKR